jgi:hypothetical protein
MLHSEMTLKEKTGKITLYTASLSRDMKRL